VISHEQFIHMMLFLAKRIKLIKSLIEKKNTKISTTISWYLIFHETKIHSYWCYTFSKKNKTKSLIEKKNTRINATIS